MKRHSANFLVIFYSFHQCFQNGKYKCGGAHGGKTETSKTCFQWNTKPGTWTKSHSLRHPRYGHVTWVAESGLYLMGGSNSPRTTEIINDGGSVMDGFPLKYDTKYV